MIRLLWIEIESREEVLSLYDSWNAVVHGEGGFLWMSWWLNVWGHLCYVHGRSVYRFIQEGHLRERLVVGVVSVGIPMAHYWEP